jgi:hypothetical protein
MVEGWVTEEDIGFAINYMDLQVIGKAILRHEGRLSGKGTQGHTLLSMLIMSHTPKHISHFYNNLFQSLPMLACISKYYEPVI